MDKRTCSVDGCEHVLKARGWCHAHYNRWRRNGDVKADKPLREWYDDPEEAFQAGTERRGDCLIWTRSLSVKGYGELRVKGTLISAHRYAWERQHGPIPDGTHVDHRYHCDTACCEISHLRSATPGQNNSNRSGAERNRLHKLPRNIDANGKGYSVRITSKGRRFYLGTYATVEEASVVAEQSRASIFGEYAGRG